jgi:nitroreductase/NAD-dependent dihydropyrimidine dehydrogenase PreA subunit
MGINKQILGIDYNLCTKCKKCIRSCGGRALFRWNEVEKKVVFISDEFPCNYCGQCIAICPEKAIMHEGFEDKALFFDDVAQPEKIISYDAYYKAFRAKRSVRYYKPEKVPEPILNKIFDAMRYAPTGSNMRAWKFSLLSDPQKILTASKDIQELFRAHPGLNETYGPSLAYSNSIGEDPMFRGAPHVLIVSSSIDAHVAVLNAGIIFTYGMLAAESLGLGSCWISWAQMVLARKNKENRLVRKSIGVKTGVIHGIMILGYPDIRYHRCPPRRPLKIKRIE